MKSDSNEATKKDLIPEVEEISDPRDRSNRDGSEEREDPDQVKHRLHALFGALYYSVYQDSIDNVKEERGQMWGSGKLFPWKQMPPRLASSGLVLVNWPEGVTFPGEERSSHTMSKGISDLTCAECSKLLAALNDTGENQLHIQSISHHKGA